MFFKRKAKVSKASLEATAKAANKIRFGVKAKLQIAFGVVALMTVVAAAVAMMSFSATERGFERVAGHEVPVMTDALRLSASSGEISAAAARFVSAKTTEEQRAIADSIASRSAELTAIIGRLRAARGGNPAFKTVEQTAGQLEGNLASLKKVISERMGLRAKLEAKLSALHKVHGRIADKLTPIVDDSYFDVVSSAEDIGKNGDKAVKSIINGGLQMLQSVVDLGAETNLVTGLLSASALTNSQPILALLEDRFTTSAQRAQKILKKLPDDGDYTAVKTQIAELLKLADFKAQARVENETDADRLKRIFRAHESLTGLLIKLVDDMSFNQVMNSEAALKKSGKLVKELVGTQISGLRNALELAAQTHLITSLISEGTSAKDAASLVPIQDRYRASVALVTKVSATLSDAEIKKTVSELIAFGVGPDSAFALRGAELAADNAADKAIKDNAAVQQALDRAVGVLVSEAEAGMKQGATALMNELSRNRLVLLVVAVGSLLVAAAIGVFYVQRKLVRRLTSLGDTMHRLSSGEIDLSVPATGDRDEIGAMARAVVVFRDSAVDKSRLERETAEQQRTAVEAKAEQERLALQERAERDQQAAAERDAAMAKLTADFEAAVGGIVAAAVAGDFSQRVDLDGKTGFVLNLGKELNLLCENTGHVLDDLVAMLGGMADGDLTRRITADYQGTFATLKDAANSTASRLSATITAVSSAASEVQAASAEIASSTMDLSQRTEQQAAGLEETTASMEEISSTVKKNAENAQQANQFAATTRDVAGRGGEVVAKAVDAMSRIQQSSHKIADIITVIDEIARQTNLLALNAAVEAARAGDAGRGFAVVASEVRSLAQRSSQAAKDIKDLITNSSAQVKDGVDLVNRTGKSLDEILSSIKSVADIVAGIAAASTEQAAGLDHISKALNQMDEVTQQNSALVEENAATAKALEQQAEVLTQQVSVFHVEQVQKARPQQARKVAPTVPPRAPAPGPRRVAAAPALRTQGALAMKQDLQEF